MKKIPTRFLIAGALILLMFTSVVQMFGPPKVSAANSDMAQDIKRSNLYAAEQCLIGNPQNFIDDNDDVAGNTLDDAYGDMFNDEGNGEHMVVGFYVRTNNGVINCKDAIVYASHFLYPSLSDDDIKKKAIKAITGNDYQEGQSLGHNNMKNNAKSWASEFAAGWQAIPEPADNIKRARLFQQYQLINMCFSVSSDESMAYDDNRGDFKVDGVGVFKQKDTFGPGDVPFITANSTVFHDHSYHLGGVTLGFGTEATLDSGNWHQNNTDASSDFYPLGMDFPGIQSYTAKSIVDCHWVKKNKSWIFAGNIKVVDDKAVLDSAANGTPTPTAPDSTDSSKVNPTCESQGGLSWILCPIINGLADAADALYSNVIAPWLQIDTLQIDGNSVVFQAWSSLRVIGNIVLIIAMLVIVFGQAVGGGMVDAYTAKKVLPKILIAAIMLNLSIYIVAVMVDITNILGHGLNTLFIQLVAKNGGQTNIDLSAGTGTTLGIAAAAGAASAVAVGSAAAQFFLVFILLPGFLAFLGVVVTLILRQGLIIALIIISPVAFALYCLPAGDKYFKQWWSLLFKALLIYPIISLIFGVAKILAITTNQAGNGQKNGLSAIGFELASIVLLFVPIFLIPFAFKLAGGAIGSLYGTLSGFGKRGGEAIKGNANDPNSLRSRTRFNAGAGFTRSRAAFVRKTGAYSPNAGRISKRIGGLAGYGDILAKEAAINRAGQERLDSISNYGDDTLLNARSAVQDDSGKWVTLDGNEVSYAAVQKAQKLYPTLGELQASANYRLKKTSPGRTSQNFKRNAAKLGKTYGLTDTEVTGLLTGVGFARQNERLEFKHAGYGPASEAEVADYGATPGEFGYLATNNDYEKGSNSIINPEKSVMNGFQNENGTLVGVGKNDTFADEMHNVKGTYAVSTLRDTSVIREKEIQAHWEKGYREATDPNVKKLFEERLKKVYESGNEWSTATRPGATVLDDHGQPVEGYGGVAGAPPAVKNAVRDLVGSRDQGIYSQIMGTSAGGGGGGGLITPGSPGFNIPPGSRP